VPKRGASAKSVPTLAPRLRPAGGALADLREGLHAVQAPQEKPRKLPGTPRKKPLGVPAISLFQQTPERQIDMAAKP